MGNRKNKVLAIAFIAVLTSATGCGITITRNCYHAYPDQNVKKSNRNEAPTGYRADTLINNKNGQN